MKESFKIKYHRGVKDFSTGTSLHGFAELYTAQTTFWKMFWIFVLFGSCAFTVFQIERSVTQYFNNPTYTVVSIVDDSNIYYPPLKVCYWQWFYWVDWEKAMALSPNQEVFHYAFHYFNAIFTSNKFNLSEAESMLKEVMISNNFSGLFDLYKAIARPVPIIDGDSRNVSKHFTNFQIVNSNPYYWYCYEASSDLIYAYFRNSTNSTIVFYTKDETYQTVKRSATEDEYSYYIAKWIDRTSKYTIRGTTSDLNLTTTAPPVSIILDDNVDNAVDVVFENDAYTITIRGLAYTWLHKPQNPCAPDIVSMANSQSCQLQCWAIYASMDCNCLYIDEAIKLGQDQMTKVCYKDVNFITTNRTISVIEKKLFQNCSKRTDYVRIYEYCLETCTPACNTWKYEQSFKVSNIAQAVRRVGEKNVTKITIIYPSGTNVVGMTEINAQSWENFIGNVGGILGIWTGASLVSLIQLVYLCCFSHQQKFADRFQSPDSNTVAKVSPYVSGQEKVNNSKTIGVTEQKL